jgi:hypothetical protein
MLYFMAIHADESVWTRYSEEERALMMKAHEALERDLRAAGKYRGCGGLATADTATTVRRQGDRYVTTDGPFAEAKEQFGGFYLVETDDLDDALAIAKRIPVPPNGGVEIRPVAVESLVDE